MFCHEWAKQLAQSEQKGFQTMSDEVQALRAKLASGESGDWNRL